MLFIQDFIAIGIDKKGFRLKLENEVKKLTIPEPSSNVPVSQKFMNIKCNYKMIS